MTSPIAVPKSGVYTNTSARQVAFMFKRSRGKYFRLQVLPGESFEVDLQIAQILEGTPVFKSGGIKRGKVAMPPGRSINLTRADVDVARRVIAGETDTKRLREWAKGEQRGEVLLAISERLRQLS